MRNLTVSFRKIFTSTGFWLCVGATVILLFAMSVYTDFSTQNRYSVIRALTDLTAEERAQHYELCRTMVMREARSGWFTMFVPIITAFCFVPHICAERDSNAVRLQVFRSSRLKYNAAQFFSGTAAAGMAVLIGYALFCAAVYFLFPAPSEYSGWGAEIIAGYGSSLSELMLETALYGMFHSIPAMFCTAVMRNKYLIMCLPFFVKYALTQTVQMIFLNAVSYESTDLRLLEFVSLVNPDGLLFIADLPDFRVPALFFGITAAVFAAAYLIIEQNRRDCGA
ncbi:MAG: hypothetical protein J1F04_09445 [Oscillospiraceae bacterium]|nr:hypothetical protein [Oscillospiraceae bacterium]